MFVLLLTFLSGARSSFIHTEQNYGKNWPGAVPVASQGIRHPTAWRGRGFLGTLNQAVVDNLLRDHKRLPPNQCTERHCCTGNVQRPQSLVTNPQSVRRSLKTSTRTQTDNRRKPTSCSANISSRKVVVLDIHHFVSHIAASLRVGIWWGAELTEHKRAWGWEAAQRLCHNSKVKEQKF